MIEIINHYFLDRKGNPILKSNNNNEEVGEQAVSDMAYVLSLVANAYQPSQSLVLSIGDIRSLNKAIDILEEGIDDNGVIMEIEDEHFAILKKVVLDLLPRFPIAVILRNAPQIEDFLEELMPKSKFNKSHI